MENTYWNSKGTYADLNNRLEKLIPISGSVEKPSKNKMLERFRKASNAYYDIFNNGGGNRGQSISKFFGSEVIYLLRAARENRSYFMQYRGGWNRVHEIVEPIMDQIILDAAIEQNFA